MFTTTTPRDTSADGSPYVTAPPVRKAPPWIQTITGKVAPRCCGVKTSRYRQSSLVEGITNGLLLFCGQVFAEVSLWIAVVQGCGSAGAFQRSAPTGGAAYGMRR